MDDPFDAEARIAAAEERATAAEINALRTRVAHRHGLSPDDAELLLTGADEQTLELQATAFLNLTTNNWLKQANVAPREGNNPSVTTSEGADDAHDFVRELFDRAN